VRRRNPFDVLDVSPLASFDEARAAYRRLATIFHPDRFVEAREDVRLEAEKQMRYVNTAWNELQVRLRATDQADREERERMAEQWAASADTASEVRSAAEKQAWAATDDDSFASRARHARTKQRTWAKSSAAGEQRAREQERAEATERAEFIRQAQERLAEEEAQRAGTPPG
jgi:curved DNA-binding protein CbpA